MFDRVLEWLLLWSAFGLAIAATYALSSCEIERRPDDLPRHPVIYQRLDTEFV